MSIGFQFQEQWRFHRLRLARSEAPLLDVLACSIAEHFYELRFILTSPEEESKCKQRVKMLSDTTRQSI